MLKFFSQSFCLFVEFTNHFKKSKFKVMRAAAASIKVLRPGGHWRIAVPDAYFPKYFSDLYFSDYWVCISLIIIFIPWYFPVLFLSQNSLKYLNSTKLNLKIIASTSIQCIRLIYSMLSEWYQQYARAGQILSTQPHMVMWSVDTLPQLFEVIIFADFFFSTTTFLTSTQAHVWWRFQ